MASAAFYINDLQIKQHEGHLILAARRRCPHGRVFDEVYLTMPEDLASFFRDTEPEKKEESSPIATEPESPLPLSDRFKRFPFKN